MKQKRAFTLIQLLIILAMLALLAGVVLVFLRIAREKARIAKGLQFASGVHHELGVHAVGIWDFDDQAADDATIHGATFSTDTPSKKGYALEFNRSENDWVQINSDIGINGAMTISLWFKTPDENTNQYFVDNRNPGTWWFVKNYTEGNCGANPGNICFENRVMALDSDWKVNEWTHILVTDDTTTAKMYINGELIGTGPGQTTIISTNLRFGTNYTNSEYFQGLMDDIRVYDQAITSAQVRQLYVEGAKLKELSSLK